MTTGDEFSADGKCNFTTGAQQTNQGWLPYDWAERIAICMESGMSKQEAEKVARADVRRSQKREAGNGEP